MVGRYKVIRGVSAAAGGLPRVSMDATDIALASIVASDNTPVLYQDIKPAVLAQTGSYSLYGRDRGTGRTISAQRATVGKIASDALFNGRPVINCLANDGSGGSDLTLEGAPVTGGNFTWFAVVSLDPVLKATPRLARLLAVNDPVTRATISTLQFTGSGGIGFVPSNGNGNGSGIPSGSVPAANTAFVVAASYNFSTLTSRMYLNGSTILDEDIALANPSYAANHITGIGGPTRLSAGDIAWQGKIARIVTFKRAFEPDTIATVMNILKAEYGITA